MVRKSEVLFEGANTRSIQTLKSDFKLDIKEDFAYLFCGHWINGN